VGEALIQFLAKVNGLLMFTPTGHPGPSVKTNYVGRFKS
jgi:hypothetical protein